MSALRPRLARRGGVLLALLVSPWLLRGSADAFPMPLERRAPEILAVVVELAGDVEVRRPNGAATPVDLFELVPSGSQVVLGEASRVVLFCAEHLVRFETLEKPGRMLLDRARCRRGEALAGALRHGSRRVDGPRLRVLGGRPVLEDSYRSDATAPSLLRPRCPPIAGRRTEERACGGLLDPRPTLIWRQVPGAIEYRLRVDIGAATRFEQRIRRDEAVCSAHHHLGDAVCRRPWPETWPSLSAGDLVGLSVDARSALHRPWPRESIDPTLVQALDALDASAVRDAEAQLEAQLAPGIARELLAADLLVSYRLLGEAAERLEAALDDHPSAELRLALGDIYRHQLLLDAARGQYRSVLAEAVDQRLRHAAASSLERLDALQEPPPAGAPPR